MTILLKVHINMSSKSKCREYTNSNLPISYTPAKNACTAPIRDLCRLLLCVAYRL